MRFSKGGRLRIVDLEHRLLRSSLPLLRRRICYRRSLERLWALVEEDYGNPDLSLPAAARQARVSQNYLNLLLRAETGFTFHQLLNRYRLLQASKMMISKDYTFLEIALETGFGTLGTLERQVRGVLGMSPRELRILLRNGHGMGWR